MNATGASRRFALRDATAEAHATLDERVGEWRTREDYTSYLSGLANYRVPTEAGLSTVDWPKEFGSWRPLALTRALQADAEALHLELPFAPDGPQPSFASVSDLLGELYVLEGSGLGARLLVRRAAALGLEEATGARHLVLLAGDAEGWRRFLAVLESNEEFDLPTAAAAANRSLRRALAAFPERSDR